MHSSFQSIDRATETLVDRRTYLYGSASAWKVCVLEATVWRSVAHKESMLDSHRQTMLESCSATAFQDFVYQYMLIVMHLVLQLGLVHLFGRCF
jgi:hypothetical protein